jgi:protein-S-isoprenylcysteine O-methyltransferase Ste14
LSPGGAPAILASVRSELVNFLFAAGIGVSLQLAELLSRGDRRAEAKDADAGSIALFALATGGGMGGALLLAVYRGADYPWWVAIAGVPIGLAGVALRAWSIRTLGRYFTRTVQVSSDQPVIDVGPYRRIRHPSYTALVSWALGFGIALGSVESILAATLPMIAAVLWRTRLEERALAATIGEPYRAYQARTKRFIPGVF